MSDEQIVKAITMSMTLAAVFSALGKQDKARLFAAHAVRLTIANAAACQRWTDQSKAARQLNV